MIRHVIWDWNGTLVDDVEAAVNAINRMLARRRLPVTTLEHYRETFGFPVKDYYRSAGFTLEREDWDAMAREYHANLLAETGIHVRPSAAGALRACRGAGVSQGILSAAHQHILEEMLQHSGLTALLDHVTGSDNLHGHSKAECGRDLLCRLGLPPPSVLFVGDTLHDYDVARLMGCRCLLVSGGHQSRRRLEQAACPVIDDLSEVPAWLNREGRMC